ncbi:MAG: hypothetical protein MUE85_22225 [Microscillaceae bacterium]|nr:hypothetical protein [Microscillaceae bacterium]
MNIFEEITKIEHTNLNLPQDNSLPSNPNPMPAQDWLSLLSWENATSDNPQEIE